MSSVTFWITQLKAGNFDAAQPLWERYFEKMVRLARQKLRGSPRRAADEEDVALSTFDSFFQGVCQGRFPHLRDRDNLWPLLVVITARKALDLVRYERRLKRGGGEAPLERKDIADAADLDQVVGTAPTPEFAALMADECQRLLDILGDEELRSVALWKLEGFSNEEIAEKLGCVTRSVGRKLRAIRSIWDAEDSPP